MFPFVYLRAIQNFPLMVISFLHLLFQDLNMVNGVEKADASAAIW